MNGAKPHLTCQQNQTCRDFVPPPTRAIALDRTSFIFTFRILPLLSLMLKTRFLLPRKSPAYLSLPDFSLYCWVCASSPADSKAFSFPGVSTSFSAASDSSAASPDACSSVCSCVSSSSIP